MADTILGIRKETLYALMFILLLVILGIVTFHYYVYVSSGKTAALRAGTGFGFSILPNRNYQEPRPFQEQL